MEFVLEGSRTTEEGNLKKGEQNVILIIIDLEIPVLLVNINERFLNQQININEMIKFDV